MFKKTDKLIKENSELNHKINYLLEDIETLNNQISLLKRRSDHDRKGYDSKLDKLNEENKLLDHKFNVLKKFLERQTTFFNEESDNLKRAYEIEKREKTDILREKDHIKSNLKELIEKKVKEYKDDLLEKDIKRLKKIFNYKKNKLQREYDYKVKEKFSKLEDQLLVELLKIDEKRNKLDNEWRDLKKSESELTRRENILRLIENKLIDKPQ